MKCFPWITLTKSLPPPSELSQCCSLAVELRLKGLANFLLMSSWQRWDLSQESPHSQISLICAAWLLCCIEKAKATGELRVQDLSCSACLKYCGTILTHHCPQIFENCMLGISCQDNLWLGGYLLHVYLLPLRWTAMSKRCKVHWSDATKEQSMQSSFCYIWGSWHTEIQELAGESYMMRRKALCSFIDTEFNLAFWRAGLEAAALVFTCVKLLIYYTSVIVNASNYLQINSWGYK